MGWPLQRELLQDCGAFCKNTYRQAVCRATLSVICPQREQYKQYGCTGVTVLDIVDLAVTEAPRVYTAIIRSNVRGGGHLLKDNCCRHAARVYPESYTAKSNSTT